MKLFADPTPPSRDGLTIVRTAAEALHLAGGHAAFVDADPAWGEYDQEPGAGRPQDKYPTMTLSEIADVLDSAGRIADRLLVWHCWPLLVEMVDKVTRAHMRGDGAETAISESRVLRPAGRSCVTGGAWGKGGQGIGYHWLGRSEPALLYARSGAYLDRSVDLGNAHYTAYNDMGEHSTKPECWEEAMIRRWSRPNDLVVVPFGGLGGTARAALRAGRRCIIAEIDDERRAKLAGYCAADITLCW